MATESWAAPKQRLTFLDNAIWQAEVCNACRYCEGFCAVFPALERRRDFHLADLQYLANLCFDCRACFYACMYAPPHEFGVNLPRMLSQVRRESYEQYAMPAVAQRLFNHQWLFAIATTVLSCAFLVALIALSGDIGRLFGVHVGEGAFYRVLPYTFMFIPSGLISVVALGLLLGGGVRFLRRTHGRVSDFLDLSALGRATVDVLGLRYLRGGGAGGCTYPTERASHARTLLHHLVFYGFLAAFASTTVAFFQQDILGWLPPYPLLSVPVVLGSIGGSAMILGCCGLIALKWRADRAPADARSLAIEYVFLIMLAVVNITGMLLLALRETASMGTLLVLHIGTVFSLYFAIPYSKFAHFIYRYAALVQNRIEERDEQAQRG
jgi:citrate/tricarballylate utilization protein